MDVIEEDQPPNDSTPFTTPQHYEDLSNNILLPTTVTDEVALLANTPNHAATYVALSITTFIVAKSLLRQVAPRNAKVQGPGTVWKWVNTANSMVHSLVTGVGAVVW